MTDIKSRLVDGMRGQGIRLPDGDWLRLDEQNLKLIAERLLSLPGIAIVDTDSANDAVAAAICNANCGDIDAWEVTYDKGRDHWRKVAAAALFAVAVQAQEEKR